LYLEEKEKEVVEHPSCKEDDEESDVTLDKCLELFTATERLGPDDPWYCSKCKDFRQATKKFDLWKVPPILVIHLKRFSYRNKYWREKLETFVNYPVRGLDLSSRLTVQPEQPPIYDLYAVSNHFGSMGGGHYTAYALNKNTSKWYKFDDSHVSEIDEQHVIASSAYVLFYRRRDTFSIPSEVPAAQTDGTTTNNDNQNSTNSNNITNDNNSSDNEDDIDETINHRNTTHSYSAGSSGYAHYGSSSYGSYNYGGGSSTSNRAVPTVRSHTYDNSDDTDEDEDVRDSADITSGVSATELISADSSDPEVVDMSSSVDSQDD